MVKMEKLVLKDCKDCQAQWEFQETRVQLVSLDRKETQALLEIQDQEEMLEKMD